MIRGEIALRSMGLGGIPVFNLENACASASAAFKLVVNTLRSGDADTVLALGAEKKFSPDRERMMSVFDGAWDVAAARRAGLERRCAGRHHLATTLQRLHGRLGGLRAPPHEALRH